MLSFDDFVPQEAERRAEAARLWRDEQIAVLESLPTLTQKQEDQLKALRLEREFQRRAEMEAQRRAGGDEEEEEEEHEDEDEDEDEESEEEVEGGGPAEEMEHDFGTQREKDIRAEISRSRDRFLNETVSPSYRGGGGGGNNNIMDDTSRGLANVSISGEQNNNTILRSSNPSLSSLSRQVRLLLSR